MQTIARANRVYDDEKENGLIVDYGNVYKQLEKAYAVYGEGDDRGSSDAKDDDENKIELLEQIAGELKESIRATRGYLRELDFNLTELMNAKPMDKLAKLNEATDCVSLNENTRTKFEMMARDVFRKYKALYPEEQIKPFIREFSAIEAIYGQLNQKVKSADITDIMMGLQSLVDESIFVMQPTEPHLEDPYIDLSSLDFDQLKAAFANVKKKNTLVFDLQKAIDRKLKQMVEENPLRLEFYEEYKRIIDEYNRGKDTNATEEAFDNLTKFYQTLSKEESRAVREGLTEETLAIFDLLKKDSLTQKEIGKVKKVAQDTLEALKEEKLKLNYWRESTQIRAQIKTAIYDKLLWLPEMAYPEAEVLERADIVYQHIFTNYPGGGRSVYGIVGEA